MTEAKKFDGGKAQLSLCPRGALEAMARALTFGVPKYGRDNYRSAPTLTATRLMDAALRHLVARCNGEVLDPESGLDHLDHALASLAMLTESVRVYGSTIDDTWRPNQPMPDAPPEPVMRTIDDPCPTRSAVRDAPSPDACWFCEVQGISPGGCVVPYGTEPKEHDQSPPAKAWRAKRAGEWTKSAADMGRALLKGFDEPVMRDLATSKYAIEPTTASTKPVTHGSHVIVRATAPEVA